MDPGKNLEKKNININNLNLLVHESELSKQILVKVRSTGKLLEAKVDLKNDNSAEVNLKDLKMVFHLDRLAFFMILINKVTKF